MSIQKTIQVSHKGTGNPFRAILSVLVMLIFGGCAPGPRTVMLHSELSDEAPATLDAHCGSHFHLLGIRDESGRLIFSDDYVPPESQWVGKILLSPGQYTISFRAYFYKTNTYHYELPVQMESGHLYKFAWYFQMYEKGWTWIEDATTSKVVAGNAPPRDIIPSGILKGWHRYGHGGVPCRSTALDYL